MRYRSGIQLRCETQFKMEKEVKKRIGKKPRRHFKTKVFWFKKVENHKSGDATGDKKKVQKMTKTKTIVTRRKEEWIEKEEEIEKNS